MDIKQEQAIKRLLKKLSALRVTLNNDERKFLDELVIGSANEVTAHSMKVNPAKAPAKAPEADEVVAHSMILHPAKAPAKARGCR